MMLISLLLLQVVSQAHTTPKQPLLGAEAALRRMAAFRPKVQTADPFSRLKSESATLQSQLATLSPKQATDAWLTLMRHWEAVAAKSPTPEWQRADQWGEIMMPALPEPATWPLIRDLLMKGPSTAKRDGVVAFFDDLLGRDVDVLRYLESQRHPDSDPEKEDVFSQDGWINEAEQTIALRARNLDLLAKVYTREVAANPFPFSDGVPDLVQQFGPARARPLLQKLLETAKYPLQEFNGIEAKNMARSIVLSDLSKLKVPELELASGTADLPFVSAQVSRFGDKAFESGGSSGDAAWIYVFGLAKQGKSEQAAALLAKHSDWFGELPDFAGDESQEQSIFDVVSKLLDPKPTKALWGYYVSLGRALGRTDELLRRLDGWLADPALTPEDRATYLGWRGDFDRQSGQTQRAIADYEAAIRLKSTGVVPSLLELANAVGDHDGLDLVAETAPSMGTTGSQLDLFDAYVAQDRISDAQTAVLKAARDVHNVNTSAEGQGRLLDAYPDFGLELAELYYRANQPEQIITLLHEYPSWGAADLGAAFGYRRNGNYRERTLGYYAAWALAKTGDKPLAIHVLHALIPYDREDGDTFELLNQLEGVAALGIYDQLIKSAPLDPRPLLWKGDLLLTVGRFKEAETCVRAAIALNPSRASVADGRGRLAYEVLARILKAEGDQAGAEAALHIVEAAHLRQSADKSQEAGLYAQAADEYRQAIAAFPHDCLAQEGLSESLARLGKQSEATGAFRKALELMPFDVGLVGGADPLEDYSFRKLGDFALPRTVLEGLARSHPNAPNILVALGDLYSRAHEDKAALASYEAAVKIEPRYLPAWEDIAYHASNGVATKEQAQEAALAMIRLDPSGQNYYYFSRAAALFGDKSSLWLAFRKAGESLLPLPNGPLLPLEASKRSMASGTRPIENRMYAPVYYEGPGGALGRLNELQRLAP